MCFKLRNEQVVYHIFRRDGYANRRMAGILFSAIMAFVIGNLYAQPLHWYLFIIIVFIGFFINTIILILKAKDDPVE